jgi:hypothetical protein
MSALWTTCSISIEQFMLAVKLVADLAGLFRKDCNATRQAQRN